MGFATTGIADTAATESAGTSSTVPRGDHVHRNPMQAATGATVDTLETTTSTAYVDLTTSGPAVTLTTGTAVLITVTGNLFNSTTGLGFMGFAVSGATTVAAADTHAYATTGVDQAQGSATYLLTGLTAGSNTFTAKYRVTAGTGSYRRRHIVVVPL